MFFVLKFGVKGREKFVEVIAEWKKMFGSICFYTYRFLIHKPDSRKRCGGVIWHHFHARNQQNVEKKIDFVDF